MKRDRAKADKSKKRKQRQLSLELAEEKPLRERSKRELLHMLSRSENFDGGYENGVYLPSPKQQAFIRALAEYDEPSINITKLCKKAGISREAFYSWREKPGFAQWFSSHRNRLFESDLIFIDRVVLNQAKKGELPAARIVYEKHGEMFKKADPQESEQLPVLQDIETILKMFKIAERMLAPFMENKKGEQTGEMPDT